MGLAMLVATLNLAACATARAPAIYTGDAANLTHMVMLDGSTGEQRLISAPADVATTLAFVHSLRLTRARDQSPRAGYLYWLAGYEGEVEVFRLTLTQQQATLDGIYYDLDLDVSETLHGIYVNAIRE
jgi:hypothetical protein